MERVVLDTNILVSALLTTHGNAGIILKKVLDKNLAIVYTYDIIAEYEEVLYRSKLHLNQVKVREVIDNILELGILVIPKMSVDPLPDEDDRIFLDTATACGATLITGNLKHYPKRKDIISPANFLAR
ncbi:MAG: putative toxin-antitoxin system toxin component, PIN family [Clostridiales Family XIII bacterium]|jgi:putative PIN family toxin of toxin-antitoxin system|nr:putative toxin-antitoxin system toxin component, PIN family [Clostridiales Family XIII bacterium]